MEWYAASHGGISVPYHHRPAWLDADNPQLGFDLDDLYMNHMQRSRSFAPDREFTRADLDNSYRSLGASIRDFIDPDGSPLDFDLRQMEGGESGGGVIYNADDAPDGLAPKGAEQIRIPPELYEGLTEKPPRAFGEFPNLDGSDPEPAAEFGYEKGGWNKEFGKQKLGDPHAEFDPPSPTGAAQEAP